LGLKVAAEKFCGIWKTADPNNVFVVTANCMICISDRLVKVRPVEAVFVCIC